jgi:hypothetical protein
MEERLQTILGIIELLKSNHTKLGDFTDSVLTVIYQQYGMDKTNEIISLANKRCEEELWKD